MRSCEIIVLDLKLRGKGEKNCYIAYGWDGKENKNPLKQRLNTEVSGDCLSRFEKEAGVPN